MSQQIPERLSGGAVDLSHLAARSTAAQGAQLPGAGASHGSAADNGQAIEVPSLVFDANDHNFEQIVQISALVPVVFYLRSEGNHECETLDPVIEWLIREAEGTMLLARVDAEANPGLRQAFQAVTTPAMVALVAGRPVPLVQGVLNEAELRDLLAQLRQLAAQHGVASRVTETGQQEQADAAPQLNPAHAEALAALDRGDYAAAELAYEQVLVKAPADHEAKAALSQVRLLRRLQDASAGEIRSAAAEQPHELSAQLRVADLDLSGGHVEDAFGRLLELFAATANAEDRTQIRERLLEYFEIVGHNDPRVAAARGRLANLLY